MKKKNEKRLLIKRDDQISVCMHSFLCAFIDYIVAGIKVSYRNDCAMNDLQNDKYVLLCMQQEKLHKIKKGTVGEEDKETIMIGEYKKLVNYVGDITTSNPKNVSRDMKELLSWYNGIDKKSIEDIIEFHVRFEKIHPFQDGNGRVGRMIMFRECLCNDIIPFYIEDRNKSFYIRGINKYQTNNEK